MSAIAPATTQDAGKPTAKGGPANEIPPFRLNNRNQDEDRQQLGITDGLLKQLKALVSPEAFKLIEKKYRDGAATSAQLDGKIVEADVRFLVSTFQKLGRELGGDAINQIDRVFSRGGVASVRKALADGSLTDLYAYAPISIERAQLLFLSFAGDQDAARRLQELNANTYEEDREVTGDAFGSGLITGPTSRNGGSAEYHIDTKFRRDLPMATKIRIMDSLALGYAQRGRKIEFSNTAVAGQVWNPDASPEEKANLLKRAEAAHSHSTYSTWVSIDYYIPKIGENRFGKSSEKAEILLPKLKGSLVEYGSGGGYGAYANMVDRATGMVIMKTGHGDSGVPLPRNVEIT